MNNRTIILPIGEQKYNQIIDNKKSFKMFLFKMIERYPEIFPPEITKGFSFIGYSKNVEKNPICRRMIRLKKPFNSYEDYLVHPCFIFPYLKGKTTDISVPLALRKHNLPYYAIAETFGKNAMYWYRAEVTLAQWNIVGTTIKSRDKIPKNLLVDEHHSKLLGTKLYVCTTIGENCFLGASISSGMDAISLEKAYGIFKKEATIIDPTYQPLSVNIDGYKSTKKAIEDLYSSAVIFLCFLHSFLKIRSCGTVAYDLYFEEVSRKIWHCYHAKTARSFSYRISQLEQWTKQIVPKSPFKQSILALCKKKASL